MTTLQLTKENIIEYLKRVYEYDSIEKIMWDVDNFNNTYNDAQVDCFIKYSALTDEIKEKYKCQFKDLQTETIVCYMNGLVYSLTRHVMHDRLCSPLSEGLIYKNDPVKIKTLTDFEKGKHFKNRYGLCDNTFSKLDEINTLLINNLLSTELKDKLSNYQNITFDISVGHGEVRYIEFLPSSGTTIVKWKTLTSPINGKTYATGHRYTQIKDNHQAIVDEHYSTKNAIEDWR